MGNDQGGQAGAQYIKAVPNQRGDDHVVDPKLFDDFPKYLSHLEVSRGSGVDGGTQLPEAQRRNLFVICVQRQPLSESTEHAD